MDWQKVIDSLRDQGDDAVSKAEALRKTQPTEPSFDRHGAVVVERGKTIERHRINGNFCYALANALEAGLGA